MRSIAKKIFVLFILTAAASPTTFGEVRVLAQVESERDIYVGESFTYYIIIDGENKPGQADLAPLEKYNPQSAGNRDVSQTSISIINGKTTKSVVKRYVMSYSLTARQTGQIQLPPVAVILDGQNYRTNPVEVNILKPGTTDQLDLVVSLSEQQCYMGQPIEMTVKFYVSADADIGGFQFNIPAFNGDAFYIEDPDISNQQVKEYRLNNGVHVFVSQHRTVYKGKDSILLTFSKILIPRNSGEIAIAPSSVSADVAVGRTRSRDRFFDDFFGSKKQFKRFMVSSKPLMLTVLPLPEEDKPSGFYGLVGKYTISASATPTKVNVGDPITLTIKIGGTRFLKPIQWPAFKDVPEMAANFKIPTQKATPAIENGYKVFTQTIRAKNDKVAAIPSIPLAFFDAEKGKYVIAKTEPIKLEVAPTKILTNADLEGADFAPINKEVEAIKKGLSANYEGLDALKNMRFSALAAVVSPGYLVTWAVPLTALLSSLFIRLFTHTTPESIAARRQQKACSKAISQLKKISSAESENRHELLVSAMRQYIGERFDKTAGSLTGEDCHAVVINAVEDEHIAGRYKDIITECQAARYTSAQTNISPAQIKEVIELVRKIEKKSRR